MIRLTWVFLGLVVPLVAVPLVYLLVHDDPGKLGLGPDGDAHPPEEDVNQATSHPEGPVDTRRWVESLRSWPNCQITAGFFVDWFTTSILLGHLVPYAIDRGMSPSAAAIVFGFMMAFSIVGSTTSGMGDPRRITFVLHVESRDPGSGTMMPLLRGALVSTP